MAEQRDNAVGLGVDIVEISRMEQVIGRTRSFTARVFSEAERAYCDGKALPAAHYATRFAAKEAVLKALGTGFLLGVRPRDVEVVRTPLGKPTVALHGRAKAIAEELGVLDLPISLSYTHEEAVAVAMAITDADRVKQQAEDPVVELAKRFKEARTMLDDLVAKPADDAADAAADAEDGR